MPIEQILFICIVVFTVSKSVQNLCALYIERQIERDTTLMVKKNKKTTRVDVILRWLSIYRKIGFSFGENTLSYNLTDGLIEFRNELKHKSSASVIAVLLHEIGHSNQTKHSSAKKTFLIINKTCFTMTLSAVTMLAVLGFSTLVSYICVAIILIYLLSWFVVMWLEFDASLRAYMYMRRVFILNIKCTFEILKSLGSAFMTYVTGFLIYTSMLVMAYCICSLIYRAL